MSGKNDVVVLACQIDGTECPVELDVSRWPTRSVVTEKDRSLLRLTSDTLKFAVQKGNKSQFKSQEFSVFDLSGCESFKFQVDFNGLVDTGATLKWYWFLVDFSGEVISRRVFVPHEGVFRGTVKATPGATSATFAFSVVGAISFERIEAAIIRNGGVFSAAIEPANQLSSVTLPSEVSAEAPKKPSAASTSHRDPETARAITAIDAEISKRNFLRALSLTKEAYTASERIRRRHVRVLDELRDYSEIVDLYRLDPQDFGSDALIYVLRAAFNLGDLATAEQVLFRHAMHQQAKEKRWQDFVAAAYPFAIRLGGRIAAHWSAILGAAEWVSALSLGARVNLAASALAEENLGLFSKVNATLTSHSVVTERDRARLLLLRAQAAFEFGFFEEQLANFNQALSVFGISPVALIDPTRPVTVENIRSDGHPPWNEEGETVSIIMTCFNSEKTIRYAIDSVLAQTHRNIELIIVDDFSSDSTREITAEYAGKDRRVKVLNLERNIGTYNARNIALQNLSGVYVTCQDSDDWAHPQKIEMEVRALRDNPDYMGVMVSHVRCNAQRGFSSRGAFIRPDASSLMYRRAPVLEALGAYDAVRAGGDSEFQFRMDKVFGRTCIHQMPHLLSVVGWSESSLSGGGVFAIDDDLGIFSPARNQYRRDFISRHEAAEDAQSSTSSIHYGKMPAV